MKIEKGKYVVPFKANIKCILSYERTELGNGDGIILDPIMLWIKSNRPTRLVIV